MRTLRIVAAVLALAAVTVLADSFSGSSGGGGLTQISNQTLGGAAANITFSSIPGTYNHLVLLLAARSDQATQTELVNIQFNADTGTNYLIQTVSSAGSTAPSSSNATAATSLQPNTIPGTSTTTSAFGVMRVDIPGYAGTGYFKDILYIAGQRTATTQLYMGWGEWASTAAITSIKIFPAAGNFIAGSQATLYGEQ